MKKGKGWLSDLHERKILFKPLTIIVPDERESLFKKLSQQKDEVDLIIDNPDVDVKLKLKALDTSVKLAKAMTGLLKTVEFETFTAELEELKQIVEKELAKAKRKLQERSLAH